MDNSLRESVLRIASEAISGPREDSYGTPYDNHKNIADIWSAITGYEFTPSMVVAMMIGLKLARARVNTEHADNWIDIAGYSALAWEVVNVEREKKVEEAVAKITESFRKEEARKGIRSSSENNQART